MDESKPLRLFVGLSIPEPVCEQLEKLQAVTRKATEQVAGKWVPPENWHITLTFLGNLDRARVEPLITLLEEKYDGYQSFGTRLSGAQWFPSEHKPRMIVAGVQLNAQLLAIKLRSDQAAKAMAIEPDKRSFRPHITLARFNQRRPDISAMPLPEPADPLPAIDVDQVTLYQSIPIEGGVKYLDLHHIKLG